MKTQIMLLILASTLSISCQSKVEKNKIESKETKSSQNEIQDVDFYNFTYEATNCLDETRNIKVKDGQFLEVTDQSGRTMFNVFDVTYGDLDGDKRDEAIILSVCNTGGSGNFSEGYIYKMKNGKPVRLLTFSGGDRADGGLRDTGVINGLLIVEVNDPDDNSGACCPKSILTSKYRLTNAELVKIGKAETRKLDPPTKINIESGKLTKIVDVKMTAHELTKRFVVGAGMGKLMITKSSNKAAINWAGELKFKWTTRDRMVSEEENKLVANLTDKGEYVFQVKNLTENDLELKITVEYSSGQKGGSDPASSPDNINALHKKILGNYLKAESGWRIAGPSDFDKETLKIAREDGSGRNKLPYYVSEDFNKDSQEDFAVILVSKKDKRHSGVAVFNGPFGSKSKNPAFVSYELQGGDALSFHKDRLLIGPYESDNIFFLIPKGKTYKLESADMGS